MLPKRRIKYPVGVQDFERIITGGYLYVDKTELVYELANYNDYVFLSRPRRFGKSLLLSTLEAYFLGRKELFKGLAIDNLENDWKRYPVLRLDLSTDSYESMEKLERALALKLELWEKEYGIIPGANHSLAGRFEVVIRTVYATSGSRVVVLVDEYDKPIVDALHYPELQEKIRIRLQGFYSVLKALGNMIQFAMLTGVGKFAHLSIFSGLNNLKDISMYYDYNSICGITEEEMHEYFEESVIEFAKANNQTEEETWAQFKEQYDGYRFCEGGADIYNPSSVLTAFEKNRLTYHLYNQITPTFLSDLLCKDALTLKNIEGQWRDMIDLLEIWGPPYDPIGLLYQSGYLTIRNYDPRRRQYQLAIPNKEIHHNFLQLLSNPQ